MDIEPLHPIFAADRSVIVTMAEASRLVASFHSASLGVIVDAYHVWWDPDIFVQIAPSVGHILGFHISDWPVPLPDTLLGRAMMGDGLIDLRSLRSAVEMTGYRGPIEVEIFSLGIIGRMVRELLRPFNLRVLAYDPYVSQEEAATLNISLCSLEQLFQEAQVITLHTPLLPTTIGMVRGTHLASMLPGSTFINTARGALVRQEELITVLEGRSDLHVVLDVADPEPPEPESALYTLPNVTLTPHIAGSLGSERRRLGQAMVTELQRFVAGEPLQHAITREQSLLMAMP